MVRTRRRTLSHTEIENFLTEISSVTNEISKNVDTFFNLDDPMVLPTPPPAPQVKTNADLIREFCRIAYQQNVPPHTVVNSKTKDIAKQLYDNTKYRLMSARTLNPEEFLHPIESTEAKKTLIMTLTPMLTEAEDQRKKDTFECEEFTRCKSNKVRTRAANYEYIDIDTAQKVDFSEFEMRYTLFIHRNKPKHHRSHHNRHGNHHHHHATVAPQEVAPVVPPAPQPLQVSPMRVNPQPVVQQPTVAKEEVVEEDKENSKVSTNTQEKVVESGLKEKETNKKVAAADKKKKATTASTTATTERSTRRKPATAAAATSTKPPAKEETAAGPVEKKPTNEKKSNSNNDRRGTLSPASARAMALKAVEEEIEKAKIASPALLNTSTPTKKATLPPLNLLSAQKSVDLLNTSTNLLHFSSTKQTVVSSSSSSSSMVMTESMDFSMNSSASSFSDIDLISFDDIPPTFVSTPSVAPRGRNNNNNNNVNGQDIFTVTDEEIDLINRDDLDDCHSINYRNRPSICFTNLLDLPFTPMAPSNPVENNNNIMNDCFDLLSLPVTTPAKDVASFTGNNLLFVQSTTKNMIVSEQKAPPSSSAKKKRSPLQELSAHLQSDDSFFSFASSAKKLKEFQEEEPIERMIVMPTTTEQKQQPPQEAQEQEAEDDESIPMETVVEDQILDDLEMFSVLSSNSVRSIDFEIVKMDTSSSSSYGCLEENSNKENEIPSIDEIHAAYAKNDLPDVIDESEWEIQAKRKMHEKFIIARNQFTWDMVSAQAANSAILRAKRKFGAQSPVNSSANSSQKIIDPSRVLQQKTVMI